MAILEMNQVGYRYGNHGKTILKDVNYGFEEGTFYAIVGSSGAGKSTLLALLAGLDTPVNGAVLFRGEDIAKTGYTNHRKNQISLVFQNYNLIDYLTPMENLQLVNPKASKEILLELGLTENEICRNVMKLSGGQQQRVAIARALVSKAPVILADEPTGNLDEATAQEIIEILKAAAAREHKCVIVVTHSTQLSASADVVLQLKKMTLQEK